MQLQSFNFATLLERDSTTGVFLWILQNFFTNKLIDKIVRQVSVLLPVFKLLLSNFQSE